MLTRTQSMWTAVTRLVLMALVLPLALSSALPIFARALGGPPVHVCRCDIHHSTCACPICHPDRDDLRLSEKSIRGTCGDDDLSFGGAMALAPAIPEATAVAVLPAAVSQALPDVPTRPASNVTLDTPTPPPRPAAA